MLEDPEAAYGYLRQEYDAAEASEEPLYEQIHTDVCRVNLRAWKREGLPLDWLFRLFLQTASHPAADGGKMFQNCLKTVGQLAQENAIGISKDSWEEFLAGYPVQHPAALHHSEIYRKREKPCYRLVEGGAVRLFPILQRMSRMTLESNVVAIDGRCASGKTTLAKQLESVTKAGVVHMDDFFLPAALRTTKRLAQAGGNVHYERFLEEAIPSLKSAEPFRYRCFDCGRMELGEYREVPAGHFRIVEGTYSCHPAFGEYMGLRIFCSVEPAQQLKRISKRNGQEMARRFLEHWIPMEEQYFQCFQVREKADIVLS